MSVYWQTWSTQWTSDSTQMDLSKIDPRIKIVNLAFANPQGTYSKNSFAGTGLEFSQDFSVVQGAIKILKNAGVTVILSVGGAEYPFTNFSNPWPMVSLAKDLGCDGIDIDWETSSGNDYEFVALIQMYRQAWPECKLSAACWSTGAYSKTSGDPYRGMNIAGLALGQLDWINIMAYDAGNDYSPCDAYDSYKKLFPGKIYVGIEIGQQSWGGHVSTLEEIKSILNYVKPKGDDIFIWSYQKPGSPTPQEIFDAREEPHETIKQENHFNCPHCQYTITFS